MRQLFLFKTYLKGWVRERDRKKGLSSSVLLPRWFNSRVWARSKTGARSQNQEPPRGPPCGCRDTAHGPSTTIFMGTSAGSRMRSGAAGTSISSHGDASGTGDVPTTIFAKITNTMLTFFFLSNEYLSQLRETHCSEATYFSWDVIYSNLSFAIILIRNGNIQEISEYD